MKTLKFYLVLPLIIAAVIYGCEKESDKQLEGKKESSAMQQSKEDNSNTPEMKSGLIEGKNSSLNDKIPDVKEQRMIIKTGSMSLETEKYDEAETKINETVKIHGGFISGTKNSVNASGNKSGTITLKVPAGKFDALVTDISRIGKVMNQSIQASDITEEYVDLESRLKTQKELEQRLIKLLDEKAVKLSDVIEIEEKLASVRQKIESIEGKMKLLKSQSDLSTLTINVYEPSMLSTSSGGGFFYELKQAIKKGLSGFTKVLAVLIVFIISVIPVLLLAYIVYRIIKLILKRRKQNKSVKQ